MVVLPEASLGGTIMERSQQTRLRLGAPAALAVTAAYIHGEGWRVSIKCRHDQELWVDVTGVLYSHLSTAELADVLEIELPAQLGS